MFLAEAQEHLQELNLAVVQLEEDPSNQETVDGIFRIAHSLKGMSATMGFAAIAQLTHVMEDVFELLRQRSGDSAMKRSRPSWPAWTRCRRPSSRLSRTVRRTSTRLR